MCVVVVSETCNIWTHGAATAGFALVFWRRYFGLPKWFPVAFLFGRYGPKPASKVHYGPTTHGPHELCGAAWMGCFAASTVAHTMASHSEDTSDVLFKIDRGMIAVGMTASTVSSVLTHFEASPWRWIAAVAATLSGIVTTKAVTSADTSGGSSSKAAVVVALGAQCALAIMAAVREAITTKNSRIRSLVAIYAPLAIAYGGAGGAFYASYFPEKYFPGKFDHFHGHTIMHVLVALSAFYAYKGSSKWQRHKYGALRHIAVAK